MATITSAVVALAAHMELATHVAAAVKRVTGDAPELFPYETAATPPERDAILFVTAVDGVNAATEFLNALTARRSSSSALVVGERLNWSQQITLLGAGAVDFMQLPCEDGELKARLHRAVGLFPGNAPKLDVGLALAPRIKDVVGCSAAFAELMSRLAVMAGCDAGVLLQGETGTGKEVCAQSIHYLSARASRPWVAVNCGAIPAELVESELFGHVRGAYTTAHAARLGLVHEAEGGTLFLDDVDCLPLDAQAKLLRFLQEREYRQVGANAVLRADVRVIAATNRPLRELVARGAFRQDLYFRLNVLALKVPALRERRVDIAPLALHFLRKSAHDFGRSTTALAPAALRKLMTHSWPGNVRELKHVIERGVLLARGPILQADELEIDGSAPAMDVQSFRAAKARVVEDFERGLIEHLLIAHSGNVSHAARAAQKNRRAFFALMRKYAIDPATFRVG